MRILFIGETDRLLDHLIAAFGHLSQPTS